MSDDAEKKPETEEPEEEDEEDLEKLQAEIKRMEEEAARITKETEELERKKDAKTAASAGSTDAASKTTGSGDAPSQDGYVVLRSILCLCGNLSFFPVHSLTSTSSNPLNEQPFHLCRTSGLCGDPRRAPWSF